MSRALHTIEAERQRYREATAAAAQIAAFIPNRTPTVKVNVGYRDAHSTWIGTETLDGELSLLVAAALPDLLERAKAAIAERYRIASEELIVTAAKSASESLG